ncbi:MAG TPA: phosphoribosylpyrophosphate synthetase [Saprospiraceae bacterium]|nr:phosphoribosylpyrophosphate synthetase [Saprospiraceae bacterium]HQW57207.1 phosphoribosylpyrophosphate synthetase [Saprospiraceae bacterium]
MDPRREYNTASEAINDLIVRGYTKNFKVDEKLDCLTLNVGEKTFYPQDFEVDEYYRFDGMTDPGDDMVVYAISTLDFEHKGIVVNAYGAYSSAQKSEMMKKMSITE